MKWSEVDCPKRVYGPLDENEKAVRGFFLRSIGIDLENIPESLFENCVFLDTKNLDLTAEYEAKVHVQDIVGTKHTCYGGGSWLDAFLEEHRAVAHILQGHVTKGKYFRMLKQHIDDPYMCVHLIKTKDGKYYISKNGNHRVTFYKLMYFADLENECNNLHLYWLYALVQDEK